MSLTPVAPRSSAASQPGMAITALLGAFTLNTAMPRHRFTETLGTRNPGMRKLTSTLAAVSVLATLSGCASTPKAQDRVDIIIENVTVIDPESRSVLPNRSVVVDAGVITAIVPAHESHRYHAESKVDGTGRFAVPGFIDMHAHLFLPQPPQASLNLLLANGVTGFRDMSSDCRSLAGETEGCVDSYRALQERIRRGEIIGPDLLSLSSSMVLGGGRSKLPKNVPSYIAPTTPEHARTLVEWIGSRGVDEVKTHDSIPVAAFETLVAEAHSRGLAAVGHVPLGVGSLRAARLGYRSIEHARDLLYDCSRYGTDFRDRQAAYADGEAGATRVPEVERLQRTVVEYDPELCRAFLQQLALTGVYYVPTHVTREMEAKADQAEYRRQPERKYISAERNERWEEDLTRTAAVSDTQRDALRAFFRHGLSITALVHRAGIPIMVGTDANDTMMIPGFSFHREMALLNSAGIGNMEILRSASTVPAHYLGLATELGGLSAGKQANLVLLRADPLISIEATRSIEAVVVRGRLFGMADLKVLLREAERQSSSIPD